MAINPRALLLYARFSVTVLGQRAPSPEIVSRKFLRLLLQTGLVRQADEDFIVVGQPRRSVFVAWVTGRAQRTSTAAIARINSRARTAAPRLIRVSSHTHNAPPHIRLPTPIVRFSRHPDRRKGPSHLPAPGAHLEAGRHPVTSIVFVSSAA